MSVSEQIRLAADLYRRGWTPVPLLDNRQKMPAVKWACLKVNRPTERGVIDWFGKGQRGFSLLGGSASGGLEAMDFDNHQTIGVEFKVWWLSLPLSITQRLVLIQTPGKGWRVPWLYPDDSDWDGQVLARRDKDEVSIEFHRCRLLNCPGGSPLCHPTGKPYKWFRGDYESIPTLTTSEREEVIGRARDLNLWEAPPKPVRPANAFFGAKDGSRSDWNAKDDFDRRATWEEILEPHGWTWYTGNSWTRPGRSCAVSATVNHNGSDMLYVFSSSTNFIQRKGYQKWAAFAVLNYTDRQSGITDFSRALKELARRGYGRANHMEREIEQVRNLYLNKERSSYEK